MGKRNFSDFSADASAGNSESKPSKERVPGLHAPKRRKNKHGKKTKVRPNNLNWVKKRARTIERKLRTGQNIPANIGNDLERELEHYKAKIEDANDEKKRKTMIKKYHMIRFFERKKADRLAKQIQTQIEECKDAEEKKNLENNLHVAQIDSLYAKFFPFRERYVSLYPVNSLGMSVHGGEKPETASSAARALKSERPPLWGVVEKLAKKGGVDALTEFRERKLAIDSRSKAPKERPSKHSFAAKANTLKAKSSFASDSANTSTSINGRMELKNSKESKPKAESSSSPSSRSDSDSDSDGGFFEKA